MDHSASSFLSGYAAFLDFFFCGKELDKESDGMGFAFYLLDGSEWSRMGQFNWPQIAVASIKPDGGDRTVLAVGPHGDYFEVIFDGVTGVGFPRFFGQV